MELKKKVKSVTLVRHCQSIFNMGISDEQLIENCKLSDFGLKQSQNINGNCDVVILSPLKRAIQSYSCSNVKTGEVLINHLFVEQQSGSRLNNLDNTHWNIETKEDLRNRCVEAYDYLKQLPYNNIFVFSHHDFLYEFIKYITDDKVHYHMCNGEQYKFEIELDE